MNKINFSTTIPEKKYLYKKNKHDLYKILKEATKEKEKHKNYCVSLNIRNSEEIYLLNIEYRNVEKTTDVLSFENNVEVEKMYDLGDIFINGELLEAQALEIESDQDTEFKFLFMHGLLHILGYDHYNEKEEKKMISKQQEIFRNTKIRK